MLEASRYIGIDLGSAAVRVSIQGHGIVLNEPSLVASVSDNRVIAVGSHARHIQMARSTPWRIFFSRPMRDGVIADYLVVEALLRHCIGKVIGKYSLLGPVAMLCAPPGVTDVESSALLDTLVQAGAKKAYLIKTSLAAALGANLAISEPSGSMVVDIGAATSQTAVIAINGISVSRSLRIGGNTLDELIETYLHRTYNLRIGGQTAEAIKIAVGSSLPLESGLELEIRGRDATDGLSRTRVITSGEVTEAITPALTQIVTSVKEVLEDTPPELAADVLRQGKILVGGGALLRNMDRLLSEQTGVPAYVADDPLSCVALGAAQAADYCVRPGPDAAAVGARLPQWPIAPHDSMAAVPPASVTPTTTDETGEWVGG